MAYHVHLKPMKMKYHENRIEMIDSICERNGDDNYTAIMAIVE